MGRKAAEPKITLSVDYQKALRAFMETGKATKDLKAALGALNDEIKKTAPVSQAERAHERFAKQVSQLAREMKGEGATTQLHKMAAALKEAGGAAKLTEVQVENLRRKIQGLAAAGGSVPKELQGLMGGAGGPGGLGDAVRGLVDDQAAKLGPLSGAFATLGPQGLAVAASLGAVATALGTVTSLTAKFASTGGQLADMEARLAISAQSIQELSYAADQAGIDFGTVAGGMEKMANAIVETPEKFDALGLSTERLLAMRPDEQFYAVAEAIRGIENPTLQAHAAMEVFGKSGAQLLPLIRQGVGALAAEAQRLGFVMDGEMVAAADALDDATASLSKAWDGLLVSFGGVIGQSPALTQALRDIAELVGTLSGGVNSFGRLGQQFPRAPHPGPRERPRPAARDHAATARVGPRELQHQGNGCAAGRSQGRPGEAGRGLRHHRSQFVRPVGEDARPAGGRGGAEARG